MAKPKPVKVPDPPDPSVWEHAPVLIPTPSEALPALISDGGGLPFEPAALEREFTPLDPDDPTVVALLGQIDRSRARAQPERGFRRRQPPPPLSVEQRLAGWRVLASTDDEILFGRGRPPQLVTGAVARQSRDRFTCIGASAARPLRAARDGVRASSWRLDPTQLPSPESTELHLLVTEISRSSGAPVPERLQTPEIYLDEHRVVIRIYITPFEGFARATPAREAPVIITLPAPLGTRAALDGAVVWAPPKPAAADGEAGADAGPDPDRV